MFKHIFHTVLVLVMAFAVRPAVAQDVLLDNANVAYDSAQYQLAVDTYQQVIAQYGVNAELYYNLGNAYFKLKDYPHAILSYERCLLLDPTHDDAQQNVEMARMQIVDRVESIEPMIFVQWSRNLRDMLSCNGWAYLSITLFVFFLVGCGLYFFGRRTALRKGGFYGGILCLVLFLVAVNYASQQRDQLLQRTHAIVLTPSVVVRSSPADSGTQLFTIHEGLKINVRSTLSGWSEIELSDGKVGWIPSDGLEII